MNDQAISVGDRVRTLRTGRGGLSTEAEATVVAIESCRGYGPSEILLAVEYPDGASALRWPEEVTLLPVNAKLEAEQAAANAALDADPFLRCGPVESIEARRGRLGFIG